MAIEELLTKYTAYYSFVVKPLFVVKVFVESENFAKLSMALVLLLLLLLACLNSLDDLFFDLKVFGIQEHLFCEKLNGVTVQIFKRSVISKFGLKQKFNFNFDNHFRFILA
jgi:hypothetical protein